MKKGFLVVAVLLLSAVFLSGCMPGGFTYPTPLPSGAVAATTGPTVKPGDLITQKDAESIIGNGLTPVTGPTAKTVLPSAGMDYVYYDTASKGGRFLQICIYERALFSTSQAAVDPKTIFDSVKATPTPAPTPKPTPTSSVNASETPMPTPTPTVTPSATVTIPAPDAVTGVGDEAYFAPPGLHIMSQGFYIIVSVGSIDITTAEGQANREVLKTLGAKVVENLKKILGK